ncbi:nucleotidyltransferase family protein [Congregibacter variabilis]|uniref:Nucleotidyltransferase family protein n=1 Tax=Congregibacter variabilis TaxID=3081200 RepID=A0ABZ0I4Y7_9GAMM|nr:nucleotidyltransferase family protein [Congregibacter sp. IMCC43200]
MADPYFIHRIALSPLLHGNSKEVLALNLSKVGVIGEDTFVSFIAQQGLAPLWHDLLSQHDLQSQLSHRSLQALSRFSAEAAAHYLLQKSALPEIRAVFDAKHIEHAVYKGVANRERLYDNAALRPAADIDLLVGADNRDRAIASLVSAGYVLRPNADNASHEVNLQRGALTIDLHWDILRPGRTREPLAAALLKDRVDAGDHWALSPSAALFVALVHPVFAKYATAPQSTLIRMLDLSRQLPNDDRTVASTLQLLQRGGVNTAAWIMLWWLLSLSEGATSNHTAAAKTLSEKTAPGTLRRAYLKLWLKNDLASALQGNALLVQFAFTLLAHDQLSDALSALRGIQNSSKQQSIDMQALRCAAETGKTSGASTV